MGGRPNGALLEETGRKLESPIGAPQITELIVDPGTGGVYSLCLRDRNNGQEPESETRDRKQETENKRQKTRVTKRVQRRKEITRKRITRRSIPKMANSTRVQ